MIDLHLHTTASDGQLTPSQLVDRIAAAGVRTFAVTDHDTLGGVADARGAAEARGLEFVPGIEITAVEDGRDIHVLGYFFDPQDAALERFLQAQRADRVRRVREIRERLADLGAPIDVAPIVQLGMQAGRSVGRPHIAAALVAAGHVANKNEAFDRFLGRGQPAYVARQGARVADVVKMIDAAGGICSLAHPGLTRVDDRIPAFAAAGLAALEARHSDHDPHTERRYRTLAAKLRVAVSGGSDFHGESSHHQSGLGSVGLTRAEFDILKARRT